MGIDENLALVAKLPSTLRRSEQLRTVSTALKHVLIVLKQNFELLHENLALKFVFLVFKVL